jgi:drug/metabolite transporter (DMT)-like permease
LVINLNFAVDFPLTKAALDVLGPAELLFWRWVFALLAFVVVSLAGPRTSWRALTPKTLILIAIAGIFTQTVATSIMNIGLTRTLAANLSVIFLTIPVFASLLASLFLGERLGQGRIAGLFLALVGTGFMSDIDWEGMRILDTGYLVGNVLVLVSCLGFAGGVIVTKKLLERLTVLEVNVYVYLVALVAAIPFAIWEQPRFFERALAIDFLLWLVLIKIGGVWALAAVGFTWVLSRLEATRTSVSLYLTPVFGVLLSSALLGEPITLRMLIGLALAVLGLVVVLHEDRLGRLAAALRPTDGADTSM